MATTDFTSSDAVKANLALLKAANVNYSTALADVVLVPGVPGKRIVVLAFLLAVDGAGQSVGFFSGPSSGADVLVPAFTTLASIGYSASAEKGLFWTEPGASLVMRTGVAGSTSAVNGFITYVEA